MGLSIAAYIKSFCNRRAGAHVRVSERVRLKQRTTAKETVDTRVNVIRPDRMIIHSDWPITLRCGITLVYKKDDGIGRGRRRVKVVEIGRQTTDNGRMTDESNDDKNARIERGETNEQRMRETVCIRKSKSLKQRSY